MTIFKINSLISPMKLLGYTGVVVLLSTFSNAVLAACYFTNGVTSELSRTVNFGPVVVQRDSPIGTVLAKKNTGAYNGAVSFFGCSTAWTYQWSPWRFTTVSSYGNNVYNTNIDGVGIRTTNTSSGAVVPYLQPAPGNSFVSIEGVQVELVKTVAGAVGAGTLTLGSVARASIWNQFYTANVALSGTNTIVPVACSVTNSSIPVPMGNNIPLTDFTGPGSTVAERSFDIPLDCDANTKIQLTLNGNPDGSGVAGVLALDPFPSETVATGVGLQLLHNGTPVTLGTPIAVGTVPSNGMYSIPLVARYYQSGATVTGGKANSTATFTLTYN